MRRDTFKKGYMILHFAVAVSIVLIGINVLIGFGKGTVEVVSPAINKQVSSIKNNWKASREIKRKILYFEENIKEYKEMAEYFCNEEISNSKDERPYKVKLAGCIEYKLSGWDYIFRNYPTLVREYKKFQEDVENRI